MDSGGNDNGSAPPAAPPPQPPRDPNTAQPAPREQPVLNNYYCYECERNFQQRLTSADEPRCTQCGSNFCELIGPVRDARRPMRGVSINHLPVPVGGQTTSSTTTVPGHPGINVHHQSVQDPNQPNVQSHMVTIAMNADDIANAANGTADMAGVIMRQLQNVLPPGLASRAVNAHIQAPNGQPIRIQNPFNMIAGMNPLGALQVGGGTAGGIGNNPANFAWGVNGMEAILNRLMEEAGNDGSARPLAEETISAIESYPLLTSQVNSMKDSNSCECSICMSEFNVDTIVKKLPPCNHTFHCDCIDAWLRLHNSCPVCRTEVQLPGESNDVAEEGGAEPEEPPEGPSLSYFS